MPKKRASNSNNVHSETPRAALFPPAAELSKHTSGAELEANAEHRWLIIIFVFELFSGSADEYKKMAPVDRMSSHNPGQRATVPMTRLQTLLSFLSC